MLSNDQCHGETVGGVWYDSKTCKHIDEVTRRAYALADKPSNPKDLIGSNKVPMGLLPTSTQVLGAVGHLEGHLKYGLVNWRETGVKFSIYYDALLRHMSKLNSGEWADPVTKVPHLGNAIACLGIIGDAAYAGKLIDDRPRPPDGYKGAALPEPVSTAELIDSMSEIVVHLKDLFGDKKPVDYFIDGPKQRE
jgi:hypothetical protein